MKNVMLALTHIVQKVALLESATQQVRTIVDSISEVIDIDVCSLYRMNQQGEMQLLASHGLPDALPVSLPSGKGLVGLVARSRHTLNLEEAANHPDYYYIPQLGEEQFRSFCGVPLVRFGEVIGVLVVQSRQPKKLNDEYEAFLSTLAAHLVLMVADIEPNAEITLSNHLIKGVSGAPGINIGMVRVCDTDKLSDVSETRCDNVMAEIAKWHELVALTKAEMEEEQRSLGKHVSESIKDIFDAYLMLLTDQALSNQVQKEIEAGFSVPTALRLSVSYFFELFSAMDDAYLKARGEDIVHLGNKLLQVWRGDQAKHPVDLYTGEAVILVGAQISASDIASLPVDQLAGVISFAGSSLSHTAVLANALGIPAVMGTGDIKGIRTGEQIIVDGNAGYLYRYPNETLLNEYQQIIIKSKSLSNQLESLRELPGQTNDGINIRLFTNTGLLADIMPGIRNGAEGVGLYRTEIPFMVRQSFPTEDEQVDDYRKVFEAYQGKPVYVRTLDIGGDKQLPYYPIKNEENPALGWRGIRFCLDNIQLLMTQVRAIIRASMGHNNLHILLPMIASTQELSAFLDLLDDACQQLQEENQVFTRPKVGVMVEVPAAISQLGFWKNKLDFISIGSNDLSQYLLALDRNNARVANRYDHVHPAVLSEVNRIVQNAKNNNLPVSLCGEMASDPIAVLFLLGIGLRTLSMSSTKLPRIKWLIRSITIATAENFANEILQMDNVKAIRTRGAEYLYTLGLHELLN